MSITYVQSTTVCVSDQDAALDFYVHKLGFEVREDAPFANDQQTGLRWLAVAPPGAQCVLVLAKGYGGCDPSRVGNFTGIVLQADNIQATYDELSSRGVRFTEAPTMQSFGMLQAQFLDQDGNRFVLVSEPRYIVRQRSTGSLNTSGLG